MTKACEEIKHFYSDHSQPGRYPLCDRGNHMLLLPLMCFFLWTEFRQTEDWTARSRYVIHKNIQEDPWNLPHSIKNLVESLQRFVDGEQKTRCSHVPSECQLLHLTFILLPQMGRTSFSWLCSNAQVRAKICSEPHFYRSGKLERTCHIALKITVQLHLIVASMSRHISAAAAGCDLLPGGGRCPLHTGRAAADGITLTLQQRWRVPGGQQGDQPQVAGADIRHWGSTALPVHAGSIPSESKCSYFCSRNHQLWARC